MNAMNIVSDALHGGVASFGLPLAMFAAKKPETDVSGHIEPATTALWIGLAAIYAFFLVRPEMWRALFFRRVDARPAALFRIGFGIVVLWTFFDLWWLCGEFLFTDQGLWLTDMARKKYGASLDKLWDPEHGFENWYDIFVAFWGSKFSILHMRSDPAFANALFAALAVSGTSMIFGFWTRTSTIITWFLVSSLYNYSPIYYTGGDTVLKTMMFLSMFIRLGDAYSIDAWRKRKRAILDEGVVNYPLYPKIPMWPMVLMMMQTAIIYIATGVLKSGSTWNTDFTATYYAMQLDHFYRFPATGFVAWLQKIGFLPLSTFIVHWWEMLFAVGLIGMALRGFEKDVAAGRWVSAALWRKILGWICVAVFFGVVAYIVNLCCHYYIPKSWKGMSRELAGNLAAGLVIGLPLLCIVGMWALRRFLRPVYDWVLAWVLGKRIWLGLGLLFHLNIDIMLNVGTFPQVTVAPYLVWLSGAEVFALWQFLLWRAAKAGEGGRPELPKSGWRRWLRLVQVPWHRLQYRVKKVRGTVLVANDEMSIRRAALIRSWDVGEVFEFRVLDGESPAEPGRLRIDTGNGRIIEGDFAGRLLISACPGLWLLWPIQFLPGAGRLALRLVGQR